MEKIDVIVPAYNVEEYIEVCIDSLLQQTYQNVEILLVDDGSTDRTSSICDRYAQQKDHVKVIHQVNRGLSAARNVGLQYADGEYVCFVDSDDFVHPWYLEHLLHTLQEQKADMVFCDYVQVPQDASLMPVFLQPGETREYDKEELFGILADVCHREKTKLVVAWNKLYKREIFENLTFVEGKIHEDEFIIHRILSKCKKVAYLSWELYYYRIRTNSITGKAEHYNLKHMDVLEAYEDRREFYKQNLGERLTEEMTIALCEMVTVQYKQILESNDLKLYMPQEDCTVNRWLRSYMHRILQNCREDMTIRKRGKYLLFVLWPKAYYKRFWEEK